MSKLSLQEGWSPLVLAMAATVTVTTTVVTLVWVKHCPALSYSPFLTGVAARGLAGDGDPQGMEKTQPPLILWGIAKILAPN